LVIWVLLLDSVHLLSELFELLLFEFDKVLIVLLLHLKGDLLLAGSLCSLILR
jgi:hypothetical protein